MRRSRIGCYSGANDAQPWVRVRIGDRVAWREPERQKEWSEEFARSTAESARMSGELSEARTEIKLLREKIDALIQRLFGAQSESR